MASKKGRFSFQLTLEFQLPKNNYRKGNVLLSEVRLQDDILILLILFQRVKRIMVDHIVFTMKIGNCSNILGILLGKHKETKCPVGKQVSEGQLQIKPLK